MPANTVDPSLALAPPEPEGMSPRLRRQAATLLDRWPFRRKLNILVIAPVVVVGVLLGVGIGAEVEQAREADRIAALVRDSEQVTRLIDEVQAEHRLALVLSVRYDSARPGAALPSTTEYRKAQRSTDTQIAAVRSAFGSSLSKGEARGLDYLRDLAVLRDKLERGYVPAADIDPAYAAAVDYLIDGSGLDRFSGSSASSVIALLDTVLRADAAHAAFESAVFSAQSRDANALTEYTRAVGAHELYEQQVARFERMATPKQVMLLGGIERSAEQNGIESQFTELQIDPASLQGRSPAQLREGITTASKQAETRLEITGSLIEQIAARADAASASALRKALIMIGLAVLGFAIWLAFSVLVRRSVLRPVRALTDAAHEVAEAAGEELARVADDDAPDGTPLRTRPIPVPVRDEIGELAETFNRVQVMATHLLERQVQSRRNVAEMFGNVGRRVSNLTSRQLLMIDAVEREETDPNLLEQLYRIDHIAVRLQRNADSLMLLAGIRETAVKARPASLANVIRAALGQIEGYQRVSLRSETEVTIAPDIHDDLTLMLAELLENAVAFSPSDTPVEVTVGPGTDVTADGGALIEVIDHGMGMSAERLTEENARLVRRERLDLVPTKVLGLFVVGALARRWGVRVTLSRTSGGGVTSTVWIPSTLLLTMSPVSSTSPSESPSSESPSSEPSPSEPSPSEPSPSGSPSGPAPAGVPAGSLTRSQQEPGTPPPVPATAVPLLQRRPVIPSPEGRLPRRARTGRGAGSDEAGKESRTPLRRRVRGATLAMTTPPTERAIPTVLGPVDAEAVRSELDEFEDALRRAEKDSTIPQPRTPEERSSSPEQQSQKESGQ